ncbi:MAG: glucose-1-phosphate cytidylyltransferase, partial [Ferruginibacter sp.]|nr:glucose-1-phosphate cytidylyltransferase [Ferruginibacter sp.]
TVIHGSSAESFKVTLVDTGLNTKTAGRLKLVQKYTDNEDFMLTYGDGVCDVNIHALLDFHKAHGKIATVTSIQLDARFGGMDLGKNGEVESFREKVKDESKWINGGFFVLKPEVFNYLQGDMSDMMWEDEPLEKLTEDKQLMAFQHLGFWKCMDALRDKIELEELWEKGNAKWKLW